MLFFFSRKSKLVRLKRLSKKLSQGDFDSTQEFGDIYAAFQQLVEGIYTTTRERMVAYEKYFLSATNRHAIQALEEEAILLAKIPDEKKDESTLARELKVNKQLIQLQHERINQSEGLSPRQLEKARKKHDVCQKRRDDIQNWINYENEKKAYENMKKDLLSDYENARGSSDNLRPDVERLKTVSSTLSYTDNQVSPLLSQFQNKKPMPSIDKQQYCVTLKGKSSFFQKNVFLKGIKHSFRKRIFRSSFDPESLINNIFNLSQQMIKRDKKMFQCQEIGANDILSVYLDGLVNCLRNLSDHKLHKLYNHFQSSGFKNLLGGIDYFRLTPGALTCKEPRLTEEQTADMIAKCGNTLESYLSNTALMVSHVLQERGFPVAEQERQGISELSEISRNNTRAILKFVNTQMPIFTEQHLKWIEESRKYAERQQAKGSASQPLVLQP